MFLISKFLLLAKLQFNVFPWTTFEQKISGNVSDSRL